MGTFCEGTNNQNFTLLIVIQIKSMRIKVAEDSWCSHRGQCMALIGRIMRRTDSYITAGNILAKKYKIHPFESNTYVIQI